MCPNQDIVTNQNEPLEEDGGNNEKQSLFIIRHGDRWDYSHPEWKETTTRLGDPPLSTLGHQQARETGIFLDSLLHKEGFTNGNDITWLASPFLRCIQTSDNALNSFTKIQENMDQVKIHPEYSIFEIDGHNGVMHDSLPSMEERKCYFPRLNETHESLFVPELPETKADFVPRCERAMKEFHKRYVYKPRTAIVMVSHAAGVIALTRAVSQLTYQDINPAGPCGIFRLTRTSNTNKWDLDHYALEGGLNGHTKHLTTMGNFTVPWNNYGDKSINKGYTGPPKVTAEVDTDNDKKGDSTSATSEL